MRRFIFLAACGAALTWQPKQDSRIDLLCAFAAGPTQQQIEDTLNGFKPATMSYSPSGGLRLVVRNGCFSSTCDRNPTMTCTTSVNGKRIITAATTSWEEAEGPQRTCSDDCGYVSAGCDTGPLEDGIYDIVVGDRTLSLPVSGTQVVPCIRR